MFVSNLKVAWRAFRKNGSYSVINALSLAFGLACCILLLLWINDELSYDRFHKNAARIYRVEFTDFIDGHEIQDASTSAPLAPALVAEFPEISEAVRFARNGFQLAYQGRQFSDDVFFSDPSIFKVFDLPLIMGDPRTALMGPSNILISQKASRKYFGNENPLGKTLTAKNYRDFIVSGVFKDIPYNSHLHFDFLGQFAGYAGRTMSEWGVYNYYTYILVKPGFRIKNWLAKIPAFIKKYQVNIPDGSPFRYELQPLTRIHLHGHARHEIEPNGSMSTIYIFSIVILFVLLVAGFNYVNFQTAQHVSRMREVGIRKAMGASRHEVALQFLSESVMVSTIAFAVAVSMVELILPAFAGLTGKQFSFNFFHYPSLLALGFGFGICTGLLAGAYPAIFFSSAAPVQVLKGLIQGGFKAVAVRNGLVTLQFAISITFLIGTFVIARQMHFVQTMKLGLDKSNVVVIPVRDESALTRINTIEHEILGLTEVVSSGAASFKPGSGVYHQNYWREGMREDEYPMIAWMAVDYGFIKTLGIELRAGRDFSREYPSDAGQAYILNESAARELGWSSSEEAIGRAFKIIDKGTIIGVVKNFNFDSLRNSVEPLVLCIYKPALENIYVRIRSARTHDAISRLKNIWQEFAPHQEFAYEFLDQEFDDYYKAEFRLGRIFAVVTTASILIAALGLFGLAALSSRSRTKEIGIRKVLGASVTKLVRMLAFDFSRLALLANIPAWPLGYYVMRRWLTNFAYRASISLWIFLAAGCLTLVLAFLIAGWQSFDIARANPAESLRYE